MLDPVLDVVQVDHRDALESRRIRAAELGGVCARHLFAVNVAAAASRRPVDCLSVMTDYTSSSAQFDSLYHRYKTTADQKK